MTKRYLYRDAGTGRLVTEAYADENPLTTVREPVDEPDPPGKPSEPPYNLCHDEE